LSALKRDVMDKLSLESDPRHSHDLAGTQITANACANSFWVVYVNS